MNITQCSKKPLFLFLILTTIFSTLCYFFAFSSETNLTGGFFLLQFSPGVSAILTKLFFQKNLKGLGWKWGKLKYQLISWSLPFIICLISFGLVWIMGFGAFGNESFILEAQTGLAKTFNLNIESPVLIMIILIVVNSTIGLLIGFAAIGEEIGWRGFLVVELNKHFNFTKTSLISGILWGLYHVPLLIIIVVPKLNVSIWPLLLFTLTSSIGLSCIMAWLRIKSGSVWTAVIFHAALNIHIQGFFQNLTSQTSSLTNYISGEQGLMMALITLVIASIFWKKRNLL
ncbi:MAG: CPBP family intramembrane metalloprotease [Spirochaetaceae bacterium]